MNQPKMNTTLTAEVSSRYAGAICVHCDASMLPGLEKYGRVQHWVGSEYHLHVDPRYDFNEVLRHVRSLGKSPQPLPRFLSAIPSNIADAYMSICVRFLGKDVVFHLYSDLVHYHGRLVSADPVMVDGEAAILLQLSVVNRRMLFLHNDGELELSDDFVGR
jgi:hypothetical protein